MWHHVTPGIPSSDSHKCDRIWQSYGELSSCRRVACFQTARSNPWSTTSEWRRTPGAFQTTGVCLPRECPWRVQGPHRSQRRHRRCAAPSPPCPHRTPVRHECTRSRHLFRNQRVHHCHHAHRHPANNPMGLAGRDGEGRQVQSGLRLPPAARRSRGHTARVVRASGGWRRPSGYIGQSCLSVTAGSTRSAPRAGMAAAAAATHASSNAVDPNDSGSSGLIP